MLWEVEIQPKGADPERERVCEEYDLLTHAGQGGTINTLSGPVALRPGKEVICRTARGYFVRGSLSREQVEQLARELLIDPLTETGQIRGENAEGRIECGGPATVLLRPGVMDPAAMSVVSASRDLGIPVDSAHSFRRYFWSGAPFNLEVMERKVLCNEAIERIIDTDLSGADLGLGTTYTFRLVVVPIRELNDEGLLRLSREGQLSLNLPEMHAIQEHFRAQGRDPTDVELETLAQTWSEHCSHKTLKGQIDFNGRRIDNLLKETIFGATQELRSRFGSDDWCVSVFEDNAGVVRFDDSYHVCFKVETHNHPSAIEPYGGANTGLGGVIRDPLGTGLGAKPICNTDVFCFAPPDTQPEDLPPGVLHPRKVMKGVVAGVRDYGNRIGIPTVNGAVIFDPRYLGNPLVYCGTVGLIPVDRARKQPQAVDLIVAVGGRTGRDGIHGATFSSIELTAESEKESGGAVQIGNPITEKKLLDVLLQARDSGLYHAITDCGAGGFSSAVGEMGEKLGATVHLERAPLKYEGLSYTEIWISEAQERMILAVPPDKWPALEGLCRSEDVEATVLGTFGSSQGPQEPVEVVGPDGKVLGAFVATPRLRLYYQGTQVADLAMDFLHHGRPPVVRQATGQPPTVSPARSAAKTNYTDDLVKILASYSVCSKEWIVRQYDHEVQGGTVVKPLVGINDDGPGDAAVVTPVLGSWAGLAIGCGINPRYGDLDPYWMAAAAIDEAVRNVVAVGADPARVALLDNFCWGNTDRPEVLGSLVRAAEACRDVALAYSMPFISGKDSLNNEFRSGERLIVIPPTLLISALGRVPDVRRCVTMDLKEPGNLLFLLGATRDELGGSHYHLVNDIEGGEVPRVDLELAPKVFRGLHQAIQRGLVRACHDLSEGGLAVAVAEMAFAGGVGADVNDLGGRESRLSDAVLLFSESPTRFLLEVHQAHVQQLRDCFEVEVPLRHVGQTLKEPRLRIAGSDGEWVVWAQLADLKEAWQRPLRW
ncbi:MAG: AIR synthase-related protein [Gemmataceae bacterium]|nr:AIR synthase-related protein [Gemmataceae bacterium]